MGFERDEVPSRVEGGALVGLGKAQKSRKRFSPKAKELAHQTKEPPEWVSKGTKSLRGSRAAPSWVWEKPRNPASDFRQRRKSSYSSQGATECRLHLSGFLLYPRPSVFYAS